MAGRKQSGLVTVDVWPARVGGPASPLLQEISEDLSPSERERWQRLIRPESRNIFLTSRRHLRAVLSRYLGLVPAAVPLIVDARGKPCLDGDGFGCQFSLSHAGDWAVVAVAAGAAVGVDLEPVRAVDRAIDIAERFFPRADAKALAAVPSAGRSAAFLTSWTLKEALAKADGRGIELLSRLVTGIEPISEPGRTVIIDGDHYAAASFKQLDGYLGAVAAAGDALALTCHPPQ